MGMDNNYIFKNRLPTSACQINTKAMGGGGGGGEVHIMRRDKLVNSVTPDRIC